MMNLPAARSVPLTAPAVALALFAGWTLATWLLEGRIETFLRPEAAMDRAVYAIIANMLIGIVAAIAAARWLIGRGSLTRIASGFGPSAPSAVRMIIGLSLGLALYVIQGAPSLHPIVLINAFAQVLVVSAAEVLVCWAVVGATIESLLKPRGRLVSLIGAAAMASLLFGAYHFAHSPPFNTVSMVALLTVVGLATSAFFFISRDVYATILFHNFLALFGVVRALAASGELDAFAAVQPPLLMTALAAVAVLALSDRLLLRGGSGS
jgi:hypothetical protein